MAVPFKKIEKVLILNTKPNRNNRVYELHILELIKDQINSKDSGFNIGLLGIPEFFNKTDIINVDFIKPTHVTDIAFTYDNARIENDELYVDINICSTIDGKTLKNILDEEEKTKTSMIVFRPNGIGNFVSSTGESTNNLLKTPNKISDDYELVSISAIPSIDDAIIL